TRPVAGPRPPPGRRRAQPGGRPRLARAPREGAPPPPSPAHLRGLGAAVARLQPGVALRAPPPRVSDHRLRPRGRSRGAGQARARLLGPRGTEPVGVLRARADLGSRRGLALAGHLPRGGRALGGAHGVRRAVAPPRGSEYWDDRRLKPTTTSGAGAHRLGVRAHRRAPRARAERRRAGDVLPAVVRALRLQALAQAPAPVADRRASRADGPGREW